MHVENVVGVCTKRIGTLIDDWSNTSQIMHRVSRNTFSHHCTIYTLFCLKKNKSSYVITFQSTNEFHTINCCQSCQGQTCKITPLIQCCYVVFRARTWACVTDWLGTNANLAVKHTDLKWDNPPTPFTQTNHLDRKWQRLGGGQVPFLSADSMMDIRHVMPQTMAE